MAAKKQKTKKPFFKVNLFIQRGERPKIYVTAFKWLLSTGRFIVVLVELVVIGAFVYRYKIDNDISNLQDKIKEQEPYIQSLQPDEDLIRQTQFQLSSIKQAKSTNLQFGQIMQKIAKITPTNITINNITFDRAQNYPQTFITISGVSPSNLELSAFINTLQSDKSFSDITLSNISFQGATNFTITGKLTDVQGVQS